MVRKVFALGCLSLVVFAAGCDEVPNEDGGGGPGGGGGGGDPLAEGTLVEVPTGDEPTYVDLDSASIVGATDAWDLRFERKNIFTNGGASGDGEGAAFGPNDLATFGDDTVPADIPFLFEDEEGGAFFRWYAYDGSTHLLYSRFHVYGIRRPGELYKVQVLRFYDEQAGAPVPALYQLRVATITDAGVGETEVIDIDGTAGGMTEPNESDPSGCVRLSTRAVSLLTPAEAAASTDWDLCFRRATI
ncbi:MAG: HmuY family protein, partial [Myxococcales bacterium]|nr:HmuY family protein [Myxococcales bacterium]